MSWMNDNDMMLDVVSGAVVGVGNALCAMVHSSTVTR